jgi:hypothetical protein
MVISVFWENPDSEGASIRKFALVLKRIKASPDITLSLGLKQ